MKNIWLFDRQTKLNCLFDLYIYYSPGYVVCLIHYENVPIQI